MQLGELNYDGNFFILCCRYDSCVVHVIPFLRHFVGVGCWFLSSDTRRGSDSGLVDDIIVYAKCTPKRALFMFVFRCCLRLIALLKLVWLLDNSLDWVEYATASPSITINHSFPPFISLARSLHLYSAAFRYFSLYSSRPLAFLLPPHLSSVYLVVLCIFYDMQASALRATHLAIISVYIDEQPANETADLIKL